VQEVRGVRTEAATCVICGEYRQCYQIPIKNLKYIEITSSGLIFDSLDYTYICRECLERLRDFLADIEAEEDARG